MYFSINKAIFQTWNLIFTCYNNNMSQGWFNTSNKILKKLTISKILVLSFIFVIFIGTFLLSLPISNKQLNVSILDHLFSATSATCVTGLITVVIDHQYTFFGKFIILLLIQIGGLGLMTFISVALLFINKKLNFGQRRLLTESLNKDNIRGVSGYIIDVVKYSFFFEIIGCLLIALVLVPEYGFVSGMYKSIFLSISAFCNAGIDVLGAHSLLNFQTNVLLNLTVAFLIIAGGLGYAVWFDLRNRLNILKHVKKYLEHNTRFLKISSKLILIITLYLILFGMIFIFIFEYNNTLKDLNLFDKILVAFFNSVTLRTAGFSSVDYGLLLRPTKLIMMFLMFIGGSPGGTAGGIKTTTFWLLFLLLYTKLKNKNEMLVYNRNISNNNFNKAFTIFGFYIVVVFLASLILFTSEHQFESIDILFEIISALATVGLNTVTTADFSVIGKCVIIVLMFIGRLGPITIAYSLKTNIKTEAKIKHPEIDIVVG